MKRPGEHVKLRVAFGEVPLAETVLCLSSGRRYWVLCVRGKTLHCRVMAPGEEVPAHAVAVLPWFWASSKPVARAGKPLAQLIAEASSAESPIPSLRSRGSAL